MADDDLPRPTSVPGCPSLRTGPDRLCATVAVPATATLEFFTAEMTKYNPFWSGTGAATDPPSPPARLTSARLPTAVLKVAVATRDVAARSRKRTSERPPPEPPPPPWPPPSIYAVDHVGLGLEAKLTALQSEESPPHASCERPFAEVEELIGNDPEDTYLLEHFLEDFPLDARTLNGIGLVLEGFDPLLSNLPPPGTWTPKPAVSSWECPVGLLMTNPLWSVHRYGRQHANEREEKGASACNRSSPEQVQPPPWPPPRPPPAPPWILHVCRGSILFKGKWTGG